VNERALLKRRLQISARLTLIAGAIASTAIFLTASQEEQNALVNEFQNSKAYRHELEAYGGKLSIVSDELIRWFFSLWHGETLAFTVAFFSIAVTLLLFWAARHIPTNLIDQSGETIDKEPKG
jgi:hypothetical protein